MGDKKSPTRPKRQAKQTADDGYWDCSVCTFRNTAEAFKCSICDVRKGTSTRTPCERDTVLLLGSSLCGGVRYAPPSAPEARGEHIRSPLKVIDGADHSTS
ncbi:hypothetical protein KUCAC02_031184 [Chaenocephalus aceratus]|uniref:Uncharacterized protein n=1 Tax=Chaenocephalus aceratus TaxID=36190 RepID=A0ACB9XKZ9_CHAAC|nr:hypothetical protein KUCAC02_031184 [Chaenocephalus aceratus]